MRGCVSNFTVYIGTCEIELDMRLVFDHLLLVSQKCSSVYDLQQSFWSTVPHLHRATPSVINATHLCPPPLLSTMSSTSTDQSSRNHNPGAPHRIPSTTPSPPPTAPAISTRQYPTAVAVLFILIILKTLEEPMDPLQNLVHVRPLNRHANNAAEDS